MKFLSQSTLTKLTITRKTRTMRVNPKTNIVTLRETSYKIELSLPSIFCGFRNLYDRLADTLRILFLPRVYAL